MLWLLLGILFTLLTALIAVVLFARPSPPLGEVLVDDGRIIVVEAITYGADHKVGNASPIVERFGRWMPKRLRDFLTPKVPRTAVSTDSDTLVIWLNALDANSRTNVDCQKLRVEMIDENGDLWGQKTRFWRAFETTSFIRIGHAFAAYPRADKDLTLRITPWSSTNTVTLKLSNPRPVQPMQWSGASVPVSWTAGDLTIELTRLAARTNGGPDKPWETPARYWEPEWRLHAGGTEAAGWLLPEWTATDPLGNEGQFLGLHQPVLRYAVSFQPAVTNLAATTILASLPAALQNGVANDTTWLQTNAVDGVEVVAIGLMTSRMNFFTDGVYQAVPPIPIGPTQGGAPTGWVSASKRVNPLRAVTHRGHYTDRPTVYLQCVDERLSKLLGVRVRDEQNRYWPTTRETQGSPDGIIPFMLDISAGVTNVTPEIVLLKPLEAEFTVRTPAAAPR